LGVVKAVTLIKQGTLMNWRRYREALLLTGERQGIRVVRLIHRDSVAEWRIWLDNFATTEEIPSCGMTFACVADEKIF